MQLSHMKYRDRTEIITLILTSTSRMSGVLKTKIMYEAFGLVETSLFSDNPVKAL